MAVEQHLTALAVDCLGGLPSDLEDSQLVLLREFVHCQLMVQQLGTAEESYARSAVEVGGLSTCMYVCLSVLCMSVCMSVRMSSCTRFACKQSEEWRRP